MNKQTDLKGPAQFHTVLLCLYVADPATSLASNSVLGTLFFSESSLFIQLWNKYIFLSFSLISSLILHIWKNWAWISCPRLHSAPSVYLISIIQVIISLTLHLPLYFNYSQILAYLSVIYDITFFATLYLNSITFWRQTLFLLHHYIYLIALVTSYYAGYMLHQSQSILLFFQYIFKLICTLILRKMNIGYLFLNYYSYGWFSLSPK